MIVNSMKKNNSILDLITAEDYTYVNTPLSKQEFIELEEFIKNNCFVLNEEKNEDRWEYRHEIEFLYKGKPLLLKHFKSYTSDCEYFLLRNES